MWCLGLIIFIANLLPNKSKVIVSLYWYNNFLLYHFYKDEEGKDTEEKTEEEAKEEEKPSEETATEEGEEDQTTEEATPKDEL